LATFFLSLLAGFKNIPIIGDFPLHEVSDVRRTEARSAEPLEPQSAAFDFEMSVEELKRYTSPLLIIFQNN
jgi:hypothetical protein